jgi:tetratricopeptide (TPR) repeat protein
MRSILLTLASLLTCAMVSATADVIRLEHLERAVMADPEDLQVAAEYRQHAIASADFDRPIAVLGTLAKRANSGPNIHITLALAYVDKVPSSGDIRRLYLGRDAMSALTRSIALRPTVLAYYIRGVINLFYNSFIFHRTDKGVADLTRALAMANADTPPALVLRVYTALGDGYSRLENLAKAREVWAAGLAKFPDDAGLRTRLTKQGVELEDVVTTALTASRRMDTSLAGFLAVR